VINAGKLAEYKRAATDHGDVSEVCRTEKIRLLTVPTFIQPLQGMDGM